MVPSTQLVGAQQLLRTQYAVAEVLAGARSLSRAAPRMLKAVCEGLDWDVGELWLVDGPANTVNLSSVWSRPALRAHTRSNEWRMEFAIGQGIPGEVWRSREAYWLPDVSQSESFIRAEQAAKAGLRSVFGYPVLSGGQIMGVIEFFSTQVRERDDMILEATASLGRQFGAFLRRADVEHALRASEKRLRMALEAGKLGDWEWDVGTNAVTWSRNLEAIHGIEPGSFGGTFDAYMSDVHPKDRERVLEQISSAVERGSHEVEYRIIRPDGAVRWLLARGEVLTDEHDAPVKMVGVCTDITERKQQEQQQRFLSEASAILVKTLDPDELLQEIAGLIVGSLADWCAIDLYDGDSIQRAVLAHHDPQKEDMANRLRPYIYKAEAVRDTLSQLELGEALLYEHLGPSELKGAAIDAEHLSIMEELGFHSAMVVPMRVRQRLIGGITLICGEESTGDYTSDDLDLAQDLARRAAFAFENARLYQQSEETSALLLEANQFKDDFVGFVSHELRTPLTTIYGGARILTTRGDSLDTETRAQVAKDIEGEAERLHRVIENLFVLARPEQPANELPREPLRLAAVIDRVATRFARRQPDRLATQVPDDLPLVLADGAAIEQVLVNLINNAEKYTDSEIEVVAARSGSEVVTSVCDRGPGIPEAELERLFDRYYRSSQNDQRGLGLGLTVCKRLIEAHGGRIWVEARSGGGLTAAFALPAEEELDG